MKTCMAVTIDMNLFKQIENLRGREKRSTFVEHILRLGLSHYLHAQKGDEGIRCEENAPERHRTGTGETKILCTNRRKAPMTGFSRVDPGVSG